MPIGPAWGAAVLMVTAQRLLLGYLPADDAFIAFRCARNLAESGVPAFDAAPVFVATSVSYTAALGWLGHVGVPIPAAAAVLGWAGDVMAALLLSLLARRLHPGRAFSTVALLLWLFHPVVALNAVAGMETSWFLAWFLGVAWALSGQRVGLALFLAAVGVWIRIDALVVLPIVVWVWWRGGEPRGGGLWVLSSAVVLIAYVGVTVFLFGSPIPHSALAKASGTRASWHRAAVAFMSFGSAVAGVLPAWFRHVSPHVLLLPALACVLRDWAREVGGGLTGHRSRRSKRGGAVRSAGAASFPGSWEARRTEEVLTGLAVVHAGLFVLSARPSVPLYPWYHVPFVTLTLLPALQGVWRWVEVRVRRPTARRWAGHVLLVLTGVWLVVPWGLRGGYGASAAPCRLLVDWVAPAAMGFHPGTLGGGFGRAVWSGGMGALIYQNIGLLILFGLTTHLTLGRIAAGVPRRPVSAGAASTFRSAAWASPIRDARSIRRTVSVVGAGVLVLSVASMPLWLSHADLTVKYQRRERAYLAIGAWARSHLLSHEVIGAREVGALGWAAWPLRLHDELGLVSSGTLGVARRAWVRREKPALVVETSRGRRPAGGEVGFPGYLVADGPHNRVLVREDLVRAWIRDGPRLP